MTCEPGWNSVSPESTGGIPIFFKDKKGLVMTKIVTFRVHGPLGSQDPSDSFTVRSTSEREMIVSQ